MHSPLNVNIACTVNLHTCSEVSGALTGLYRNTALYNTTNQHRTLVCIEFSSRHYVTDPKLCVTTPEGIASKGQGWRIRLFKDFM